MEEKLNGIVVSAIDYRENDKLINVFTLERGMIVAALKGVKKAGAKLKFAAAPFCFAEFVLSVKGDKRTVIGATLTDSFYPLREDLVALYCGGAVTEFIRRFVKEEIVSPELFFAAAEALKTLSYGEENKLSVTVRFLLFALKYSGYALFLNGCFSCGEEIKNRVFFNSDTGGFYCEDCREKDMRELNFMTYFALKKAESGTPLNYEEAVFALRLIDFYISSKTEEKINSLKELNKLCANKNV